MKKLVVDAQIFQTPAWHRGMGKYSLEFIKALAALNNKTHTWGAVEIILSEGLEADEITPALGSFKGATVKKLALQPNSVDNPRVVAEQNRIVIDQYIEALQRDGTSENEIDFLILSLMQSEVSPVFPSSSSVRKVNLFYDLIPLMFFRTYLQNPVVRTEYLSKFRELIKADVHLTISKTVANDLALYLGIDSSRIHNIDGGAIAHSAKPKPIDISKPFILMPTGNDLRKNNRRAIHGFKHFNQKHDNRYSLVITSFFTEEERVELSLLAPNIVFVGNIKGEELAYLYEAAEVMLFPSEYEGLGLPILEAIEKNKPVACSDIPVFREISKTAFAFFDPKNTVSISDALEHVTNTLPDLRIYETILSKYSWEMTANEAIEAMSHTSSVILDKQQPICIIGVNPCENTMDAKIIQQSHAELTRHFSSINYLLSDLSAAQARINILPYVAPTTEFAANKVSGFRKEQALVYHLSNITQSKIALFTALAIPGVAILHDVQLTRVWETLVQERFIDDTRLDAEKQLQKEFGSAKTDLLVSLVIRQKAVVVFSEDAKRKIEAILNKAEIKVPVYVLQMPSNTIRYDDILPKKTELLGSLSHNKELPHSVKPIAFASDYEYENVLARFRFLYVDSTLSTEDTLPMVEAQKYGTFGIKKAKNSEYELPEFQLNIEALDKLEDFTQTTTYTSKRATVQKDSGYAKYAEQLADIIEQASKA